MDIFPPFFEDNRQFFESIVANSEHEAWSTRNLYDDFACLVTARYPPESINNGQFFCHTYKPYWFDLCFWSLSRNFAPNKSFDDQDADITANALCNSDGKWYLNGEIRLELLVNEASAELAKELLNAVSKFGDPALWVGKAGV